MYVEGTNTKTSWAKLWLEHVRTCYFSHIAVNSRHSSRENTENNFLLFISTKKLFGDESTSIFKSIIFMKFNFMNQKNQLCESETLEISVKTFPNHKSERLRDRVPEASLALQYDVTDLVCHAEHHWRVCRSPWREQGSGGAASVLEERKARANDNHEAESFHAPQNRSHRADGSDRLRLEPSIVQILKQCWLYFTSSGFLN